MARLALCSDLHIEFGAYTPPPLDADLVLLAGDVDTKGRCGRWGDAEAVFGAPVVAVLGNHEHYGDKIERSLDRMRPRAAAQGLTLLENEAVVVAGVRVLGCTLWTDFNLFADGDLDQIKRDAGLCVGDYYRGGINDFRHIRVACDGYRRLRPVDTARLHAASVEWLRARLAEPFAGPTVVLTHHAPSIRSLPPAWRLDRKRYERTLSVVGGVIAWICTGAP